MPCGKCKHKRGSGAHFLSGVTWHGYKTGKGKVFSGGGFQKRRRKRKKGGMSMTGGGVNFSGSGLPFSGGALRWVVNKKINGRRVA